MTLSNEKDHLRLLLYRGTGGDTVRLDELLRQRRLGSTDWTPYLGLVGLDLTVGGEPRWPSRTPIGDLARMAFQFEAAALRIRDGELALARIGVDDFPIGGFFRFRPDGERVSVSLINVRDPDIAYRYPVDSEGQPVAEVYARLADRGPDDVGAAPQGGGPPELRDLVFPRDRLVTDLAEEAERGRQLYDALGQEFRLELY